MHDEKTVRRMNRNGARSDLSAIQGSVLSITCCCVVVAIVDGVGRWPYQDITPRIGVF